MNCCRKFTWWCFALLVAGWALGPKANPADAPNASSAPQEIVLAALQAEMPEAQISPDAEAAPSDTSRCVFRGAEGDSRVHVMCYRPSFSDLDGDEKPELVMGVQFLDTDSARVRDDFLGVYTVREGRCERLFGKVVARDADRGEFSALEIKDVTGDAKPEICFRYNRVNAGMHRWQWRETFCVLSGQAPFNVLLECIAREGEGSNKAEGRERYSVFRFEDTDGDGVNELLIDRYEPRPERNEPPEKVNKLPDLYRLREGRYQLVQE